MQEVATRKSKTWRLPLAAMLAVALGGALMVVLIFSVFLARWNPITRWQVDHVMAAIPQELGDLEPELFRTTPGTFESLIAALSLALRESCGGAVFGLSKDVARQIEAEGLAFFADAVRGRTQPIQYSPWRPTPIPADWNSEGTYTQGFHCMRPSKEFYRVIKQATSGAGGYYSSAHEREILVLPRQRLVLVTFYG